MKKTLIVSLSLIFSVAAISAHAVGNRLRAEEISAFEAKPKKELKEVTFAAHLHCQDCVDKVKENISFEKGVKGLDISLEEQTIKIKYDPKKTDEATLKAAIEKLGYKAHKVE